MENKRCKMGVIFCTIRAKQSSREPASMTVSSRDLTNKIIKSAEESIPMSSGTRSHNFYLLGGMLNVLMQWQEGKKVKGKLWRSGIVENIINYKRTEAITKQLKLKEKQQQSWAEFLESMNANATTKETCNKLRE